MKLRYMVVNFLYPYNIIVGRPTINDLEATLSTIYPLLRKGSFITVGKEIRSKFTNHGKVKGGSTYAAFDHKLVIVMINYGSSYISQRLA